MSDRRELDIITFEALGLTEVGAIHVGNPDLSGNRPYRSGLPCGG